MEMIIGIIILALGSVIGYFVGGAVIFKKMIGDIRGLSELSEHHKAVIQILEASIKALVKNPNSGPSKELAMYFASKNAKAAADEAPKSDNVINIRRD